MISLFISQNLGGGGLRLDLELRLGVFPTSTRSRDLAEISTWRFLDFRLESKLSRLESESSRSLIFSFSEYRLGVEIISTQVEVESKSDFQTSTPSRDWAERLRLRSRLFRLRSKSSRSPIFKLRLRVEIGRNDSDSGRDYFDSGRNRKLTSRDLGSGRTQVEIRPFRLESKSGIP